MNDGFEMYIPPSFAVTDHSMLLDFVDRYSFATLFSQTDSQPVASHLPLLLNRDADRLLGHMARANSHWQTAADQRVLTVFHGPHAYISPSWYAAQNVVPTWNYIAVHATGTLRLIEDRDRLYSLLQQTVAKYESPRPQPWSMSSPEPEFLEKLLAAIVGFEIEVDTWEGKWKLSQNHPQERRERVIDGLRETGRADELAIAELMSPSRDTGSDAQ
ncbi:MAG: FMN-binding negative transcriptional regulator [Planctomycetaceae bacterium]|nr:FMN-binding negative transcriptional regulator [Planctomycetaceae bacterium]